MGKALLAILDGYGITENPDISAISHANTEYVDSLFKNYPNSRLRASGENVGLPEGQFGNSEVGHLNIGAGRIVWQELSRINKSIDDGSFYENEVLQEAMNKAKGKNRVHIMGLFSDGGVHSHYNHLFALLKMVKENGIDQAFVHALMDGRDTSPHGGLEYAKHFNKKTEEIGVGHLASIIGRYYAMDRDNRWERTQRAYDMLVKGKGEQFDTPEEAIQHSYDNNVTDEFINPSIIDSSPESRFQDGDVLIFFNIRGDRARQITRTFTEEGFDEFDVSDRPSLEYVTFTQYDIEFKNVKVAYPPLNLNNTLGEVVSKKGIPQLRIAETEKYPHVTYFFNGGVEEPNDKEERIMVPSPKVATYDLQPKMSASEVSDKLTDALKQDKYGLVILNFANPDMVGHTGDFDAAVQAVETVDKEIKRVIETATENDYSVIVIADHGNADRMKHEDGSPHTAHTSSLVPFIVVNAPNSKGQPDDGILADVAPSLLKLMEIEQPEEMSGKALF